MLKGLTFFGTQCKCILGHIAAAASCSLLLQMEQRGLSVCLSLSVGHGCVTCKVAEAVEMPFVIQTHINPAFPRNYILDGVHSHHLANLMDQLARWWRCDLLVPLLLELVIFSLCYQNMIIWERFKHFSIFSDDILTLLQTLKLLSQLSLNYFSLLSLKHTHTPV